MKSSRWQDDGVVVRKLVRSEADVLQRRYGHSTVIITGQGPAVLQQIWLIGIIMLCISVITREGATLAATAIVTCRQTLCGRHVA